jgi:hypothetical protein
VVTVELLRSILNVIEVTLWIYVVKINGWRHHPVTNNLYTDYRFNGPTGRDKVTHA